MPHDAFQQIIHPFRCQREGCGQPFGKRLSLLQRVDEVFCPKCGAANRASVSSRGRERSARTSTRRTSRISGAVRTPTKPLNAPGSCDDTGPRLRQMPPTSAGINLKYQHY